ncbi:MAG: response regulator [Kofleriaceae bacterium]|nr:response regulator [Myxococcales bacterium]MCB9560325.1 response regulator [Kofleriaceae bacterium]MCB9571745.1 response regulator [Kofleriaceae bacterium]
MREPDRQRPTSLLVALDDPDGLQRLRDVFAARDLVVTTASSLAEARSLLEGNEDFDVVVTAWDTSHTLGGELYRWALKQRVDLRGMFVFLVDEPAPELDRVVAGRCVSLRPEETEELVRVVEATAARRARLDELDSGDVAWLDVDRPGLLLVDDEPELLAVMSTLLGELGFIVSTSESGHGAMELLEAGDFDVIVVDWYMPDGSGADVYRWILTNRPWLLDRLVFLTGGDSRDAAKVAQGAMIIPKGQDSDSLVTLLVQIARKTRAAG